MLDAEWYVGLEGFSDEVFSLLVYLKRFFCVVWGVEIVLLFFLELYVIVIEDR